MVTHALALCLGPRSACASQRCELPVSRTARAAAVAVLIPVPLHPVQAPTTLAVRQTTSEHVCSLSVQLSAGNDDALSQGTRRTATDLHKRGGAFPADDEDDGVWEGGLWCGTRRTVTVIGGVPATMTEAGVDAGMPLVMRVRKMAGCSTIPEGHGPQTRCSTVRPVRIVTQVHGVLHGGAGLTMQRIAM